MPYTERQVASELLDQPAFEGQLQKLFICSTPRSGSNTLCRLMIEADLGIPHEYFNPVFVPQIAQRFGIDEKPLIDVRHRSRVGHYLQQRLNQDRRRKSLAEYIAALIRYRTKSGIFACKIQYWQYRRLLDDPVGWKLLDGASFVYLYRSDLLAQAVSAHFARLTGRWDFDDVPTTAPEPQSDFFDLARLKSEVRDLAEQDSYWRVFFAENGISPAVITYENLCIAPLDALNQVASLLGKSAGLPQGFAVERYSEGAIGLPKKRDVAAHFTRSVRNLSPAPGQETK